jgi:hypothetical protein
MIVPQEKQWCQSLSTSTRQGMADIRLSITEALTGPTTSPRSSSNCKLQPFPRTNLKKPSSPVLIKNPRCASRKD